MIDIPPTTAPNITPIPVSSMGVWGLLLRLCLLWIALWVGSIRWAILGKKKPYGISAIGYRVYAGLCYARPIFFSALSALLSCITVPGLCMYAPLDTISPALLMALTTCIGRMLLLSRLKYALKAVLTPLN